MTTRSSTASAKSRPRDGLLHRRQLDAAGVTPATLRAHLEAGRWQRVFPVYATRTGRLELVGRWRATLLWAGNGAALSHASAATYLGLHGWWTPAVRPPQHARPEPVHVLVVASRRSRGPAGIVVHRTRSLPASDVTVGGLRVTTPRRTIRDLLCTAPTDDDVIATLTRCAQQQWLNLRDLRSLGDGPTTRRCALIRSVLALTDAGVESLLEYHHDRLTLGHRLPSPARQTVRSHRSGRSDGSYEEWGLRLEPDGRLAHTEVHRVRDARDDRAEIAAGRQVLRFTGLEVLRDPCRVAADTAAALRARGWAGAMTPCPRCRQPPD